MGFVFPVTGELFYLATCVHCDTRTFLFLTKETVYGNDG
jgi:hypothetical protein